MLINGTLFCAYVHFKAETKSRTPMNTHNNCDCSKMHSKANQMKTSHFVCIKRIAKMRPVEMFQLYIYIVFTHFLFDIFVSPSISIVKPFKNCVVCVFFSLSMCWTLQCSGLNYFLFVTVMLKPMFIHAHAVQLYLAYRCRPQLQSMWRKANDTATGR